MLIAYYVILVDYNYCLGVTCPVGAVCNNVSASNTYSCTCGSDYTLSGTISSTPLIQACTATGNQLIVFAILIPIIIGGGLLLLLLFLVFVCRHRMNRAKQKEEFDEYDFNVPEPEMYESQIGTNLQYFDIPRPFISDSSRGMLA